VPIQAGTTIHLKTSEKKVKYCKVTYSYLRGRALTAKSESQHLTMLSSHLLGEAAPVEENKEKSKT
jgi:hypothetical protein